MVYGGKMKLIKGKNDFMSCYPQIAKEWDYKKILESAQMKFHLALVKVYGGNVRNVHIPGKLKYVTGEQEAVLFALEKKW